ncbi:MAG: YbaB/EbfC family nucleoid-associated protein [Candidatus Stahlbacteria bacterium]|jgi:DNA-binding YbaB/EbfC family protein|nr:YbaB/EbfC family nucleoid-associated protein [candidate division WOR-3 bacterium]TET99831.1 MAG: YbaB/EbfC family nucleoid-associated protein [Candidatus Stahlbacteria bacterium]
MLKNIFDYKAIKEKTDQIKSELQEERLEAESGGGMVKLEVDGLGNITKLEIEDDLFNEKDKELIEDLIIAAVNKSKEKLKELWQKKFEEYIGDLPLPGLGDLLS